MKKNLTYYVIGATLITLTIPTYSYSGERFNRLKRKTRQIYERINRVDRDLSKEKSRKAKKIAGKILEHTGIPFAEKAINGIDYLNKKTGFYEQQERTLKRIRNRQNN